MGITDQFCHPGTTGEGEDLGKGTFIAPFTAAGGGAGRFAKLLEEAVIIRRRGAASVQLHSRNRSGRFGVRVVGEFRAAVEGTVNGIQQGFCRQAAHLGMGMVQSVLLIFRERGAGELPGAGLTDQPDQRLGLHAILNEKFRQGVEQGRIGRRIGQAEIIHRIHEATAHEVGPKTVHLDAGKEGMLRTSHPPGKRIQVICVRKQIFLFSQQGRMGRLGSARILQFGLVC